MFLVFISYQFNYFSQFLYFLSLYGFPTSLPRLQVYFPFNLIPIFGLITGSTIIRELSIYTVHPAGIFSAVKFIKLIDAFHVIAFI